MKQEMQYCTPAQSKKLKELGIAQTYPYSNWHWYDGDTGTNATHLCVTTCDTKLDCLSFAAFSVAELIMAADNKISNINYDNEFLKQWYAKTSFGNIPIEERYTYYNSFAEAICDRLIRSLEKGFYTIEDVNNRLL